MSIEISTNTKELKRGFVDFKSYESQINIDTEVKSKAQAILDELGIDISTAVNMFFHQIIVERRLPFQPAIAKTHDEQGLDIIKNKNIPHKLVEVNEEGHIIVDKDKDPDLYDWAVNG